MKKTLLILALMVLWAIPAYPQTFQWMLYDNFNSGVLDTNKWNVDSSYAEISVEDIGGGNPAVKFHILPQDPLGFVPNSAWLTIKKKPQNVWGIKAMVRIQNCQFVDDRKSMRARIGGYLGMDASDPSNDIIFGHLVLDPFRSDTTNNPRIFGQIQVCDKECTGSATWIGDAFWGQFWFGDGRLVADDYLGYWIPFSMEWSSPLLVKFGENSERGLITYKSSPLHKMVHITDPTKAFFGISARSESGAGSCDVWFDDVYVLRRIN